MTRWFESKTFAVLLFLSWIPLATYLFPLPTQTYAIDTGDKVTRMMQTSDIVGTKYRLMRDQVAEIYDFFDNTAELQPWIMLRWGVYFLVVLTGLIAATLVLLRHQSWKIAVITSAGCYLLFVVFYSGMYLPTKMDPRAWLLLISHAESGWLLQYRELFFPAMQLILAIALFFVSKREYSHDYLIHTRLGTS